MGSSLIPSGVNAGDSFRLLFVTSTKRNATSSDIGVYNSFVQARANANTALRPFKDEFRALISTAAVDARDNTATTYTNSNKGVPIYWLGGAKVADEYQDFYDESWDSRAGKTESGGSYTTSVWTGSNANGTKHTHIAGSVGGFARIGTLGTAGKTLDWGPDASGSTKPLYALSPVITVAAPANGITLSTTALTVAEGGTATYTIKLNTQPTGGGGIVVIPVSSSDTTAVTATDSLTFNGTNWNVPQTVTLTGVEDADTDGETVTISHTVQTQSGSTYAGLTGLPSVAVTVTDNDGGTGGTGSTTPPPGAIWSATLTVDKSAAYHGCDTTAAYLDNCSISNVLDDNEFTYGGTTYTVRRLFWYHFGGTKQDLEDLD